MRACSHTHTHTHAHTHTHTLFLCAHSDGQIIEEVKIKEQMTLVGLIDKIFDKALTDTHFSELYARMCKAISTHPETPKVRSPGQAVMPENIVLADAMAHLPKYSWHFRSAFNVPRHGRSFSFCSCVLPSALHHLSSAAERLFCSEQCILGQ